MITKPKIVEGMIVERKHIPGTEMFEWIGSIVVGGSVKTGDSSDDTRIQNEVSREIASRIHECMFRGLKEKIIEIRYLTQATMDSVENNRVQELLREILEELE